jgi:hypothetical protein
MIVESNHVGLIKQRLVIPEAEVVGVKYIPTDFGETTMYRFLDASGNVLVWFASNNTGLEMGRKYALRGTVKKHDEYKGVRQTYLTRCRCDRKEN